MCEIRSEIQNAKTILELIDRIPHPLAKAIAFDLKNGCGGNEDILGSFYVNPGDRGANQEQTHDPSV
ncbi:hypothetical protein [Fischerella sp. JS2]|uniref:hypothetical protein n=1 Tax=Fischerella sp. JS2 TaxID=2597771 RepID=UPI0028E8D699|nr:hypothetical protein [Fischerella sp. JS2]